MHCFRVRCTDAFRKGLSKALFLYIESLQKGATTRCGMLADKGETQKRSKGGSQNRTLCPELGQLLYDWFIDCVQIYRSRVNYALIVAHARYLMQRLLDNGHEPRLLPNLSGEAGKTWLRRWRHRFNVVSRKTVKHLKVSWAKLKQRVRVFVKNVFALRFLWRRCFGDKLKMRWVSLDQKPAWFNNTALAFNNTAHTR